jgi:heme/copper-type cytochrome/quinol oxidase subunit 3
VTAARRISPFDDPEARLVAGIQGMRWFIASLAVLFGSVLVGYLSLRMLVVSGPPQLPPLPWGLWLSTLLMLVSSGTFIAAGRAARGGNADRLTKYLALTLALGVAFLLVQTVCWIAWIGPMRDAIGQAERRFLLTGFYVLTGMHAVHVIGGLIPLGVIVRRARAGRYTADFHPGVVYTSMYWHFLGVVWIVLYATLWGQSLNSE